MRFPGFDLEKNSYKKYIFKDIFLFSTGKNIKQNEASPEFETFCVRYGELYHMYNEVITEVFNKTNLDKSELHFSQGDEILLPSAGEDPLDIGLASALTVANVAIGRTINILKPINSDVYSQIYVSYYINHKLRRKISNLAKGSSISNVYNSDLKTLEIILPNLDEQKRTSNFLLLLNDRISTQKKIIDNLVYLMLGFREKIFSNKIRFKDEDGNDFVDWETLNLGTVLIKNSNKNKDLKYLNVQSVSNKYGFINQDEVFQDRRVASVNTSNYYVIEKGHFAYNPSRIDVGSLAYKSDDSVSIISPLYISFKADNNLLNDDFLLIWFFTLEFNFQMSNSFEGSVRNTLSYESLSKMKIKFPSIKEQTKIANFLSSIGDKIRLEKEILQKLELQKKYLLVNLFV
ncbi:restriction endonuclease subunit S [Chryseobacterium aahli]|uniref:restriction endonuclease subunit S n=1 Tax=Chryseobacterium aahli TaxID=1278643 RepID=UPI001F5FF898|nr:restriction endonuclease subunit S [Chryseobacterium aahli]MCI3938257.1 restriction endonuclease subunit S [Chryseobacterium aahli]